MVVTTPGGARLMLRTHPSPRAMIADRLPPGSTVERLCGALVEDWPGWTYVQAGERVGWVAEQYLQAR